MVTELCHGVDGRGGSQRESCSLVSSNIFFQLCHGSTHQATSLLSVGLKYSPRLFEHTRVVIESLFNIAETQALRRHMCALRSICNSHARANNGRTKAIPLWKWFTSGEHNNLAREVAPLNPPNFKLALGTWALLISIIHSKNNTGSILQPKPH